jgi:hypothetical protein
MNRRSVAISLVIVGSLLASCEDSVAPPAESTGPGWLALQLSTPPQGAQALLLRITGGPIDSIVSQDYTLFSNGAVRSDWRVLLVGNMTGGVVARIWVPDLSAVGQYSAAIEQAAAQEGFEQQAVSGYDLTIETPGRQ